MAQSSLFSVLKVGGGTNECRWNLLWKQGEKKAVWTQSVSGKWTFLQQDKAAERPTDHCAAVYTQNGPGQCFLSCWAELIVWGPGLKVEKNLESMVYGFWHSKWDAVVMNFRSFLHACGTEFPLVFIVTMKWIARKNNKVFNRIYFLGSFLRSSKLHFNLSEGLLVFKHEILFPFHCFLFWSENNLYI